MSEKKVRIGIIGCGGIANGAHIPGYLEITDKAEITALCDIDEGRLSKTAERLGIPAERTFSSYRELIASGLVDAVDICTPNYVHCEIAHAAMDAGLPFSVEKPVGLRYAEVKGLYDRVTETGNVAFVTFSWRYRPYTRYVRDIIRSGVLGKIFHIYVRCIKDSGLWEGRRLEWRFDKERGGTGVLGDLGSHMVDIVRFWGEEFDGVFAKRGIEIKERMREDCDEIAPVTTDDWCNICGMSKNGVPITISVSRLACTIADLIEFEVIGEGGRIKYSYKAGGVQEIETCLGDDAKLKKVSLVTPPEGYTGNQSESFVNLILGCKDQYTSELDCGVECQKVLEAAELSCENERYVRIEEI